MVRFFLFFLVVFCLFGMILDKLCVQLVFVIYEVQSMENESFLQGQLIILQGNIVIVWGDNFFVIQVLESDYDNNVFMLEVVVIVGFYFGSLGDVVEVIGIVCEEDGFMIIVSLGLSIINIGVDFFFFF